MLSVSKRSEFFNELDRLLQNSPAATPLVEQILRTLPGTFTRDGVSQATGGLNIFHDE